MTDTAYLDFLMTIDLSCVVGEGGLVAVRFADVPETLRDSLKRFINWSDMPTVNGELCVPEDEWLKFLKEVRARHHKRMLKASLALGAAGPTEADLVDAPTLTEWIASWHPGWRTTVLLGRPNGHPLFNGPICRTSALCGIDPYMHWARTNSRWYRLSDAADPEALLAAFPLQLRGVRVLSMSEVQSNIQRARENAGLP